MRTAMPVRARGALAAMMLAIPASGAAAQSLLDGGVRSGPQIVQYTLRAPLSTSISEMVFPVFAIMPMSHALTLDVGTSFASVRAERTSAGETEVSTISGQTDTQLRATYAFGNDFVVLTTGLNFPTGRAAVGAQEQLAATIIGSDFLTFPISNMGTGFGFTGGLAVARPAGDWNVGAGVAVRYSADFEPFAPVDDFRFRYQPGNEYRARLGVDHPFGTGRVALGFTFSKFGDDRLAGSIYNTGDRYMTQALVSNTFGPGDLTVVAWNMFRSSGMLSDSIAIGSDNVTSLTTSYSIPAGAMRVEPYAEVRNWMQSEASSSMLMSFGVRAQRTWGRFVVAPMVGYSVGSIAAMLEDGTNTTAGMTGFRAMLALRAGS